MQDFEGFLEGWYRQPLFASLARHEGLIGRLVALRRQNHPKELAFSLHGMGTGAQPSLWERLPALEVAALAMAGALDAKYVSIARRMAALSPKVQAQVIEDAGHTVHAERPGTFIQSLRPFITKHYR